MSHFIPQGVMVVKWDDMGDNGCQEDVDSDNSTEEDDNDDVIVLKKRQWMWNEKYKAS
jgi:hypothetical protein